MKITSDKDRVFYRACRGACALYGGWDYIINSTDVMRELGCTRYRARKILHELQDDGLLIPIQRGGQTEDGEVWCVHGWEITHYAQTTPIYHWAVYQEAKLCAECFGGTMRDYWMSSMWHYDLFSGAMVKIGETIKV